MSDFTPKTRLQKILCGVTTTAKTRLEKSAKRAVDNAGSGGGAQPMIVTMTRGEEGGDDYPAFTADKTFAEIVEAYRAFRPVYFEGIDGIDHIPLLFAMYDDSKAEGYALAGFTAAQMEHGDTMLVSLAITGYTDDGYDTWVFASWDSERLTSPTEIRGTMGSVGGVDAITLNKTAEKLYALCEKGRAFSVVLVDEHDSSVGETVAGITAMKLFNTTDGTGYFFRMSAGKVYTAAKLTANDPVVLTEVTGA